jgi:agmatinase
MPRQPGMAVPCPYTMGQEAMALTQEKTLNYFGLPEEYSSQENSRAVIVPVPYEATSSYRKGTKFGPKAVLEASQQVELFDDELWVEPYKIGIQSASEILIEPVTSETEKPFEQLSEVISPLVEFGKFPIILGGEQSLTLGAVRACAERFNDLSVLQINAHCDLHQSYDGNLYSHASFSYQIYKALPQPLITQVGIRNISAEEVHWLEKDEPRVNIFWARQQNAWNLEQIVHTLSDNVYLNVDVDGLDPSIMPSTGTPEPGGITWYQLTELIKLLCVHKNVVAADFVELSPIENLHAPDFLVAKLIYKLIGYRFAMELGVTKKYL